MAEQNEGEKMANFAFRILCKRNRKETHNFYEIDVSISITAASSISTSAKVPKQYSNEQQQRSKQSEQIFN